MNAPIRPDFEVWFDVPTFAPASPAPTYIALVVGICLGVLVSAGIMLTTPALHLQCATSHYAEVP